jgi:putative tryptophan/tyrosine transport system substrate-binding protein
MSPLRRARAPNHRSGQLRHAQQPAVPVIGFLSAADADFNNPFMAALKGLADRGYERSRNVEIVFRYAEYRFDRLPALTAELVRSQIAVIVASDVARFAEPD